jgi:hypothetical protein
MDDVDAGAQVEPVERRGLAWPVWVLGLIGAIAGILYVFVIVAP